MVFFFLSTMEPKFELDYTQLINWQMRVENNTDSNLVDNLANSFCTYIQLPLEIMRTCSQKQ